MTKNKQKTKKQTGFITAGERALFVALGIIFSFNMIYPKIAFAAAENSKNSSPRRIITLYRPQTLKNPAESEYRVKRAARVVATAYSSTPDQTDDTPFIAASGKHVYDGLVAANFLRFGTKVRFPDIYGDKIFTVDDRMHPRFNNRIDIWMRSREEAIQFGIKTIRVEILEQSTQLAKNK